MPSSPNAHDRDHSRSRSSSVTSVSGGERQVGIGRSRRSLACVKCLKYRDDPDYSDYEIEPLIHPGDLFFSLKHAHSRRKRPIFFHFDCFAPKTAEGKYWDRSHYVIHHDAIMDLQHTSDQIRVLSIYSVKDARDWIQRIKDEGTMSNADVEALCAPIKRRILGNGTCG